MAAKETEEKQKGPNTAPPMPAAESQALMEQLNRQYCAVDALYHEVALHLGLSDSMFWVLYVLYNGLPLTQNELCGALLLPKQTVNSTVAAMVRRGLAVLGPGAGRSKPVHLTASGQQLAARCMEPVLAAEQAALALMGADAAAQYLALDKTHLENLRAEFDRILHQK